MANRIQLRRDTAANWTRVNPVLEDGEPGLEIDTNYVKYGDGNTPWAALPYASTGSGSVSFDYSTVQEGSAGPDNVTSITGGDNTGVSLTSENWAQLMWVPNTANVTVASISQGPGTFNWVYVDDEGFHVESNVAGVRHDWRFATNGNLELPLGGSIYEVPSPTFVGNAVVIEPAEGSDPDQKLMLYPTVNEGNHLHMTSGNLAVTDIFLGSDHQYIRTRTDQGMTIGTGGGEQWTGWAWTFGANAVLSVPYEGLIRATDDSISLQTHDTLANVIHGVRLGTSGQLFLEDTTNNVQWLQIDTFAGNTRFQSNGGVRIKSDAYGSEWSWTFANTGVLTTPGNVQVGTEGTYGNISFVDTISANNYVYANGVSILSSISGNYGDSNVAAYLSSGAIETAWIHGNLTVGNLTVTGNSSIINTESYVVEDNIIQMANANPADSIDLGFVAHRTVSSTLEHTGLIRDSSAGIWRLFSNVTAQPGATVDFTNADYDVLQVGGLNTVAITATGPVNFTSSPAPSVTPGIVWPSGFQTDIYGNTQVAAYLVANPQGSTYSNTNVAAYLLGNITTGNITGTSVAAGHLVMSGTAPNTTIGDLGDLQSELRADTNYLYVSTGAYGGSNIATPMLTVVGVIDTDYYGVGGNRVRLSGVTSEYWTDIRTSPTVYWFSAVTAVPATYVSDDGAGVFSFNIGSRSGYAGSTQYIVYATGASVWKTIPLSSFQTPAFGNANVAAYLAANPQGSGTYSNTNVAAYLTTASVTTTGNISAGNVIGTHYGNAIGTTATYTGNVTAANFIGNITGNVSGTITGNVTGTTPNVQVVAGSYTSTFNNIGMVTMPNVTVTGNVTASGIAAFYAPNRPAFRVTGPGGQFAATTQITGGNLVVDFNQGSYLNTTTGYFTAPVAGLYQVNLVVRTYTNAGASAQAAIEKNDSTVIIMVEWATNTTMNHTGGSTVIKLAVGDTLRFRVLLGSISFDANDNWSVAYIG